MTVPLPEATTRWRCKQCGNLTRFDVTRTSRVREYLHVNLAGDARVEDSELLSQAIEQVTCRWCAGVNTVEVVLRPGTATAAPEE